MEAKTNKILTWVVVGLIVVAGIIGIVLNVNKEPIEEPVVVTDTIAAEVDTVALDTVAMDTVVVDTLAEVVM